MPKPPNLLKRLYNIGKRKGTMEKEQFDQFKYQNEYKRQNYDRMELLVPKGEKAVIKEAAKAEGKSVNEFVYTAVKNKLSQMSQTHVLN